jgi:hypothetical protein
MKTHVTMMTLNVITDFVIWAFLQAIAVNNLQGWLVGIDIVYFIM